ncbi:uncharacterized protein V1518DRAFT_437223 [Limtongia smithiae]|uniref:uncharacterized protein n=1 Tax=Limtongia smithiae TaxID=1125753 RepID=UPI0034CFAE89
MFSPAQPRGLPAVIPIDPPPSKREKVAKYLTQKKDQFDQYQQLLNRQRQQLLSQRQGGTDSRSFGGVPNNNNSSPQKFYRLLSSTSFTSFARAAQQQQDQLQKQTSISSQTSGTATASTASESATLLEDRNGEKLVMFPSYARRLDNGFVEIDIRGWIYAPGLPNRKNRLFAGFVRQVAGIPAPENAGSTAKPDAGADLSSASSTLRPTSPRGSAINLPKNNSSISVSSILTRQASPSPSRRGSGVGFNPVRFQSDQSVLGTSPAVNIPRSSRSEISRTTSNDRAFSPSSPVYGLSGSPRRDTYSPARLPAGTVSNRNFQPTFGNERQPLLSSRGGNSNYLINLDSDTESDYFSETDDEEVVENHHKTVVAPRLSPVTSSTIHNNLKPVNSGNDIRRQQSFYANQVNGSTLSISGHNSEVVSANAVNAPLSSSPVTTQNYFPNYDRRGSFLNLSRTLSFSGNIPPSSPSVAAQNVPPPLPPRPKLISFRSSYNPESTMQERIAPFMARAISREDVTIHVGSTETEEYSTYSVTTTDSGHFGVRLRLTYEPAISCVECGNDLITVEEVKVIESFGVSLISDIDDTVKHTGITGAKSGIFKNVFVKDYAELEIKGVADWYQDLTKMGVPIHYVSNSPWQLYPSISKFLRRAGLPTGSMHLKHYNGFLYGLLEPAVERKRFNLESILTDFPHRKFILVGDSGEMDLEAYVNLACAFPEQILAIYIRDVTTTCSDDDDFCTMSQFNGFFTSSVPRPDEIDDLLVDDSGWCCAPSTDPDRYYNRPHSPPPIHPKPANLRGRKITTEPHAIETNWSSSPSVTNIIAPADTVMKQEKSNLLEPPKLSPKPQGFKSQTIAAPTPQYPSVVSPSNRPQGRPSGAMFDLLSSSAGSTASPLAERLAAFSSTFESASPESPETTGFLTARFQQQQQQLQFGPSRIGHSGSGSASSLAPSLVAKKSAATVVPNYSSIATSSAPPPLAPRPILATAEKKPPLPPRPPKPLFNPNGTLRSSNGQHATDIASFAYRACIGPFGSRGGNDDSLPVDKKLAMWKKRVARARMMLPNGIRLRMWRIGEDVKDECEGIVQAYLEQLHEELGEH